MRYKRQTIYKLKKTRIPPESSIDIDFSFPPPNTSKEEIIYRLRRNLKVSNNFSNTNIIIEIIFIVCPIQIDFSCQKYSLTFEDERRVEVRCQSIQPKFKYHKELISY